MDAEHFAEILSGTLDRFLNDYGSDQQFIIEEGSDPQMIAVAKSRLEAIEWLAANWKYSGPNSEIAIIAREIVEALR
jgi:hypothetical protein